MNDGERIWYLLVSPPTDSVVVDGRVLKRGCRVRLAPRGNGDLLDSVLAGKTGRIESIDEDHEGNPHLAVVIDDDPGRDLGAGRYLAHRFFFSPDDVEPLEDDDSRPKRRLLIAGIGNLFLGDDGFGVEVVRRLAERALPPGVEVIDFGIRGMDLAYALGSGFDGVVLVDALRRGRHPGTLVVLEPELPGPEQPGPGGASTGGAVLDGHSMDPLEVLRVAGRLGPLPQRVLVVGCEPGSIPDVDGGEDMLTELSPGVEAAVEAAVERIVELAETFAEHGWFTSEPGREPELVTEREGR